MGTKSRNRCPGLRLRGDVFWIDIDNSTHGRIFESTGARKHERPNAEEFYRKRLTRAFEERRLGVRRTFLFEEAARKHLDEERGVLKSLAVDEWAMTWALPHIGQIQLEKVHDGSLDAVRKAMAAKGLKQKSVNLVLQVVRKVLNKAARRWRDSETGFPWLSQAVPLLDIPQPTDARPPYPLSWDEERKLLLPQCPPHLEDQVLFYVNAGVRENELCSLRWAWERQVPEVGGSVFMLPAAFNKNGKERVIVLNRVAQQVIERQRGKHAEFVFTYRRSPKSPYHPITGTNNSAWVRARELAADSYREVLKAPCPDGFRSLHVHDLRHTFGRRLRAAGVSDETRSVLLGHWNGDITTHYSAAELGELVEAVRKIEVTIGSTPTLTVLRAQAA